MTDEEFEDLLYRMGHDTTWPDADIKAAMRLLAVSSAARQALEDANDILAGLMALAPAVQTPNGLVDKIVAASQAKHGMHPI